MNPAPGAQGPTAPLSPPVGGAVGVPRHHLLLSRGYHYGSPEELPSLSAEQCALLFRISNEHEEDRRQILHAVKNVQRQADYHSNQFWWLVLCVSAFCLGFAWTSYKRSTAIART